MARMQLTRCIRVWFPATRDSRSVQLRGRPTESAVFYDYAAVTDVLDILLDSASGRVTEPNHRG